jgi:class 3 adenylate cyclase
MHVEHGGDAAHATVALDQTVQLSADHVQPGYAHFTLVNQNTAAQRLVLGRVDWSDEAVTAAQITSLQLFRDLFSSEALRPGESISVENMTILFTDLKGSTDMYLRHGDAPAFRWVMDHFEILRSGVSRHHGALIKTIGDAIMAVFTDPADAVGAALDIIAEIERWSAANPQPLILKMGIHRGACIAVTLNERLDYFGSVVNMAARLESQSRGGDVIVSEAIASDPGVVDLIAHRQVGAEQFMTVLKGFTESVALCRLTLPTLSGSAADR